MKKRHTLTRVLRRCFLHLFVPTFKAIYTTELPKRFRKKTLYLIGEHESWFAALLCPCGCQALIQLSLLREDSPHWTVRLDRSGLPTLRPSIRRTAGCRSHFVLREGLVHWISGSRKSAGRQSYRDVPTRRS